MLAELDSLRSENDTLLKTIQKLQEQYKDFTYSIKDLTPEIENAYDKVSQTISIVEKETDYLRHFQNEQKDKFSTFLRFKEILDQQEKDRCQQEIDFSKRKLEEKEQEMERIKNENKEKMSLKKLDMKKEIQEEKSKKRNVKEKLYETEKMIDKHESYEQMAIMAITDLATEYFILMGVEPDSQKYYGEELCKDDLSLQAVIKKVRMWVGMEKIKKESGKK